MKTEQLIPWRRFATEGAIIVFSILLAFSIDTWWQEAEDRERERVVLQALLKDLEGMSRGIAQNRHYNRAILDASTRLLEAGTARSEDLTPRQVDKLLGDILWYTDPGRWRSATMDMLVSAGDLADLTSIELVQMLVHLHSRLKIAQATSTLDENMYRDDLIPFLGSHANLPQILAGVDHAPGVPELSYDFPSLTISQPRDHRELLMNTEFQGLLAAKIDLLLHAYLNRALDDLDQDIDDVMVALRVSLDE